jgi:accessory gene regulator protein B
MKEKFLNNSISKIKKKNPNFSEEKLEEIAYGLEAIYLTVTKIVIIFILAFILGIFKDMLIIMIFYNIIRTTAFGMHAKKSSHCLIISILFFIGGALIAKYVDIPSYIKISLSCLLFICLIKYAPADTYKRPLLNARKRKIYKIFTLINGIIYLILIVVFRDSAISNYLFLGLLEATLMIHPLIYRMFQLPYNNYKNYDVSYS